MVEKQETSSTKAGKNDEEAIAEKRIPVFTVLRNNAILKNIFLAHTPPPSSSSTINQEQQQKEEVVGGKLLVGRHPCCNITLEHLSIIRFHLCILSKPSSHSLSIIDLFVAYGTWVSRKKIEPDVRVELNEGETLRRGGSSRISRLHWVPLSCTYDLENPFFPPLNESESSEERAEGTNQTQTLDDDFEGLDSLFSDMNIISSSKELIPSVPPMTEDISSSSYGEEDMEKQTKQLLCSQPDQENSSPNTSSVAEESKTVTRVDNPEISSFYGEEDIEKYTLLRDGLDQSEAPELRRCSQPNKENSCPRIPRAAEESKSLTPRSSAEEVRPTAPTPPATPLSCFSDKNDMFSASSIPFSPSSRLLEIISPTAQDHILECALFVRRITNGHLVLLSDDVSLKIKAMAVGLLCETAAQFRDSLANPFSERFLWTDSAPRGPTWSCVDDVVLGEKYYHGPLRKQSKSGEAAKGLKLILLHNSHYRQKTSFQLVRI